MTTTAPEDCSADAPVRRSARQSSTKANEGALAPKCLNDSVNKDIPQKTAQKRKIPTLKDGPSKVKKEHGMKGSDGDVEDTKGEYDGLSEYELERLENIKQNQVFLSAIKLLQATEELHRSTKPKPSQRGLIRPKTAVRETLPPRKSLRLQHKEAEALVLPPEPQGSQTQENRAHPAKKPSGSIAMDPINLEEGSRLPTELIELFTEDPVKEEKVELELKDYRLALKRMKISEERVAKVVKDRIFSAAFHPCPSSLLMAAGDKWGRVGLWKLGSGSAEDIVLLFETQTRPVACMAFSGAHPANLLSLSYDGSLRSMDVERAVFDEVYDIEDGLKTFDFLSHDCSTLVVGDWYGDIAIVDRRTPGTSHESLHTLDTKNVRCVHVHPVDKCYISVAQSSEVCIYDSRYLRKTSSKAVSQLTGHTLSISSAFFSPSTGNRLLTTCLDHKIRIYDTSAMKTTAPLLTTIRHNTNTGRWLSKLSAVWDPKREDCFAVGSVERPRRAEVYHESGQLQHSFRDDEHLATVQSVVAFHPSRNALLGGNASGRLHLFTE